MKTRALTSERSERRTTVASMLGSGEASLLDLVDNVVNKGIVLNGDVLLGVADIDLIYLRLSAVLCAADRILGAPEPETARVKAKETARSAVAPRPPKGAPKTSPPSRGASTPPALRPAKAPPSRTPRRPPAKGVPARRGRR